MSVIESIFRGGLRLRADASGTPAPWDDFWYEPMGGHASSAGMRVSPETSKRLGTVIACVSYRAKMFAILPCKIRRDLKGGGSEVLPKHPWARALSIRPNPVQTAFDFRYMMNAHVDLRGNAYARKVVGPGKQRELWPLHPDRVKVEVIPSNGRLKYIYNNPLTNQTETYVQQEIFHLRDWSDSMWIGQSRISMALDPLGLALARQDFMARFMKNDARTGMVITGTNFKTKQDQDEFRDNLQSAQTGLNRGKFLTLPAGLDVKTLSVTPVDAQLIEGKKVSDTEICSIFGVLPHAVGVDAGKAATFASTEQFNIMNAQQCMHPIVTMWEQAEQRDLLDEEEDDSYARHSMAAILRGDNATRFAGYAIALGSQGPAWMCPDDVRELEDLNPIADGEGKVYWRPLNMAPLGQLTASAPDDPNADDAGNDGAGGDAGARALTILGDNAAVRTQMEMLAMATAQRCVRREVSGVKRLIERRANAQEIGTFYEEHMAFIANAFNLGAAQMKPLRQAYADHVEHLRACLDCDMHPDWLPDDRQARVAEASVWIEQIAATEAAKLAALVVEGVQ